MGSPRGRHTSAEDLTCVVPADTPAELLVTGVGPEVMRGHDNKNCLKGTDVSEANHIGQQADDFRSWYEFILMTLKGPKSTKERCTPLVEVIYSGEISSPTRPTLDCIICTIGAPSSPLRQVRSFVSFLALAPCHAWNISTRCFHGIGQSVVLHKAGLVDRGCVNVVFS